MLTQVDVAYAECMQRENVQPFLSPGRANVRRLSGGEAPRACGQSGAPRAADCRLTRLRAACRRAGRVALGGSAAGRGKRPAVHCWQQLAARHGSGQIECNDECSI